MRLYPLLHPAAALYTPRMLDTLREDFARLPGLLALEAPAQPEPAPEPEPEAAVEEPEPEIVAPAEPAARAPDPAPIVEPDPVDQLGLF